MNDRLKEKLLIDKCEFSTQIESAFELSDADMKTCVRD